MHWAVACSASSESDVNSSRNGTTGSSYAADTSAVRGSRRHGRRRYSASTSRLRVLPAVASAAGSARALATAPRGSHAPRRPAAGRTRGAAVVVVAAAVAATPVAATPVAATPVAAPRAEAEISDGAEAVVVRRGAAGCRTRRRVRQRGRRLAAVHVAVPTRGLGALGAPRAGRRHAQARCYAARACRQGRWGDGLRGSRARAGPHRTRRWQPYGALGAMVVAVAALMRRGL